MCTVFCHLQNAEKAIFQIYLKDVICWLIAKGTNTTTGIVAVLLTTGVAAAAIRYALATL